MRVLLVHGFLAPGALFWPLAKRLRTLGHLAEIFAYPSHRHDLDTHARELIERIRSLDTAVAVVAHSVGGLVLHRAVALAPDLPLARRIFVATPHRGCRMGRRARLSPIARFIPDAGKATAYGCEPSSHGAPTGILFGTRDLLVRPDEADLPGADARLGLPYGHNELVLRPSTAHALGRFLAHGLSFEDEDRLRDAVGRLS